MFGRPIGQNQAIQHPLAEAYMNLEAAKLATYHAARLYDASTRDKSITQHAVGVACNSAKYVAAEAGYTACERSVSVDHLRLPHARQMWQLMSSQVMAMGGMGYASEYHVERYLRESFVPRIAPVSRVCLQYIVCEVRKSCY